MTTDPRQAENRRVRKLCNREHRKYLDNLRAGGAAPEEIARAERAYRMREMTRDVLGGSNRVRRMYGAPFQTAAAPAGDFISSLSYDDDVLPREQLPPTLDARFTVYPSPHGQHVQMSVNLRQTGRPLSDHGRQDGYRWHNALHLALAVSLTWSPVLRSMTSLERLSNPFAANIEDGPYARSVEEQAVWAIFLDARSRGWYATQRPGKPLLRQLQLMTADLEVSDRTAQEWEHAARVGVRCMRSLWEHDGGRLIGDTLIGSLTYETGRATLPVSA